MQNLHKYATAAFKEIRGKLSASVLLFHRDQDGDLFYLVMRRTPDKSNAGRWSLPGGKVEEGETPAEGAARETDEEAGFKPSSLTPLLTFTNDADKRYVLFIAETPTKFNPILQTKVVRFYKEHDEYRWQPLDGGLPDNPHPRLERLFAEKKEEILAIANGNKDAAAITITLAAE